MGYLYEELIRRFSELSNETAGEHFTPARGHPADGEPAVHRGRRRCSRSPGVVRTLLDPACGTGGMLSVAEDHLRELNPDARLEVFGQELNAETYAICRSDMMLKGQDASHIVFGNSFTEDGHRGRTLRLPARQPAVRRGVEEGRGRGQGRARDARASPAASAPGCRASTTARFLFLQHMISKMKPVEEGGSRLAIVFNGSPLFTGAAGSGESEIRRWIIENDWLEAIVALPDQLFYNTGISTYFWIVTNRKRPERRGKVQLVDAREFFVEDAQEPRREAQGDQRRADRRDHPPLRRLRRERAGSRSSRTRRSASCASPSSGRCGSAGRSTTRPSTALAATQGVREARPRRPGAPQSRSDAASTASRRPTEGAVTRSHARSGSSPRPSRRRSSDALAVRDPDAPVITTRRASRNPTPTSATTRTSRCPPSRSAFEADPTDRLAIAEYRSAVDDYMTAEVLPYVPDAWVDHDKTKIGYEIPLTRHFYRYVPPRPLEEIDAEIKALEAEIQELLARGDGVTRGSDSRSSAWRRRSPSRQRRRDQRVDEPRWLCATSTTRRWRARGRSCRRLDDDASTERATSASCVRGDVVISTVGLPARHRCSRLVDGESPSLRLRFTGVCGSRRRAIDPRFLGTGAASTLARRADLDASRRCDARHRSRSTLEIARLAVSRPPLTEQRAIADYLDAETARIDALIAKKRRMIELLDERREST